MGPDVAVTHEQVTRREMVDHPLTECLVAILSDGMVEAAPPDTRMGIAGVDEVLVLGRPAGVLPGPDDERSTLGDESFGRSDRVLVQLRHRQVGT